MSELEQVAQCQTCLFIQRCIVADQAKNAALLQAWVEGDMAFRTVEELVGKTERRVRVILDANKEYLPFDTCPDRVVNTVNNFIRSAVNALGIT